jgi:hypothetical protein
MKEMRIRSKKGTTMVEAAMIFPLVIAGVIAVLYIVIGMYQSLSLQSSLHLALRKECGERTQTVYRMEEMQDFKAETGRNGIRPVVKMKAEREYQIHIILQDRITRKEEGRSYLIDEPELIRILSFQEEELN